MKLSPNTVSLLEVAPFALVLLLFVIIPLALVFVVSFFEFDMVTGVVPSFTLQNYLDLLGSPIAVSIYLNTLKYALIVWAITLVLGFSDRLFSGVPRALADRGDRAVPGLHGAVLDLEHHPHDLLDPVARQIRPGQPDADDARHHRVSRWSACCFSDFAVILAYVHLFTLFMIVPIFNAMARIDPAMVEAAVDGGASPGR